MSHWLLVPCLALTLVLPAATDEAVRKEAEAVEKLIKDGRLKDALADGTKLAAAHPTDADVSGALAQVYFELGDYPKAEAEFIRTLELGPKRWGDVANDYLAQISFFYGRDDQVKERLAKCTPGPVTKHLPTFVEAAGFKKHRKKKGHYLVHVDDKLFRLGGHEFAANVMELIYRIYGTQVPFPKIDDLVFRVFVFSTSAGYEAFNKAVGLDGTGSAGKYLPSYRVLLIDADPEKAKPNAYGYTDDALDTMFHEGFHQFIHMYLPDVPDWFNEGFAEYFGPSRIVSADKLEVGIVKKDDPEGFYTRYSRIKEVLDTGKPVPHLSLEQFVKQTDKQFDESKDRNNVNYAQAWSFIHFLLHGCGDGGRRMVKVYFTALREGKPRAQALEEAFGKVDWRALEAQWIAYVKRL